MATVAHSTLTGAELHEPKGAAAANDGEVYVADGAASGAWAAIVPPGLICPYGGSSAPTLWLLCYGQDVSRATYSVLFTAVSTTYGIGDGSTTFGLPDLRGRVVAGQDDMGGVSANRLTDTGTTSLDGDTLGDTGGAEQHTLLEAEMAAHKHFEFANATSSDTLGASTQAAYRESSGSNNDYTIRGDGAAATVGLSSEVGSDTPHNIVQPTIILNYIIYAGV